MVGLNWVQFVQIVLQLYIQYSSSLFLNTVVLGHRELHLVNSRSKMFERNCVSFLLNCSANLSQVHLPWPPPLKKDWDHNFKLKTARWIVVSHQLRDSPSILTECGMIQSNRVQSNRAVDLICLPINCSTIHLDHLRAKSHKRSPLYLEERYLQLKLHTAQFSTNWAQSTLAPTLQCPLSLEHSVSYLRKICGHKFESKKS